MSHHRAIKCWSNKILVLCCSNWATGIFQQNTYSTGQACCLVLLDNFMLQKREQF